MKKISLFFIFNKKSRLINNKEKQLIQYLKLEYSRFSLYISFTMEHKISLKNNKRPLFFIFLFLIPLALSIFFIIFVHVVLGLIVLGISIFFVWKIVQFLITLLKSRIESTEEGINFHLPYNEQRELSWQEIDFAGSYLDKKKKTLFIYIEKDDQIIKFSEDFSHFDDLEDNLKKHCSFDHYPLKKKESIEERLKTVHFSSEAES